MVNLNFNNRIAVGTSPDLRKNGIIPAVFYGKKQTPTPISIQKSDFIKVWKQVGESGVVTLNSGSVSINTLIQGVAVDPLSGIPLHVDFYVFEKGKKIEVDIPLEFIGISPAVKDLSANLVKVLHEIKVLASPENLPHDIKVDISSLVTFDDVIKASQLMMPTGVELAENPDDIVVSVTPPKAEEVDEPSIAPDLSAIEVEKKGKKDEEAPVNE